jgi:RND family efflux transporter MFP subunit
MLLAACGPDHHAGHAGAQQDAHDHAADTLRHTGYGPQTELFAEYPPALAGASGTHALHLTRLADWRPLAQGRVTVVLSGGGLAEERFGAEAPAVPGIFRPEVRPAHAGERRLRVEVRADGIDETHDLGTLRVWPDAAALAAASPAHAGADEGIAFTKEQQWKVDFETAPVTRRALRASIPATATVRAPADGEAFLHAPVDGHLVAQAGGFPTVGAQVKKGQVLARLLPHLGRGTDLVTLELDLSRTRLALQRAERERERVERLHAEGVVADRRLAEARGEESLAAAEYDAARKRIAHYRAAPAAHGDEGLALAAPISGVVIAFKAAPGAFLNEGAAIVHIADPSRLWLEARVAESDAARLRTPAGVSVRLPGAAETLELEPGNSRLVAIGGAVDPASRTVPVIFEMTRPDPALRIGMAVQAQIHAGEAAQAPVVPAAALVDDAGLSTVYVQRDGEAFERRIVRTGLRDGGWVQVVEGLAPGERVVTRGAYLVKLAGSRGDAASHSHAH